MQNMGDQYVFIWKYIFIYNLHEVHYYDGERSILADLFISKKLIVEYGRTDHIPHQEII